MALPLVSIINDLTDNPNKLDIIKVGFSMRSMTNVSDEAAANRATLAEIRRMYYSNTITREQAKELSYPILKRINKKAAEIAKKHGNKNYVVIDFTSAMRNSY